ncbi:uncharacterized protein LOC133189205 [Saccostrea echinata]|uniref:uncharacterized protein LOC133189205 n=1 Tax=Saccostrea echinata TaxID=191078 RepID=UPI002A83CA7A|nr:uncharacterized protein LOC133189205 [Saccostrea echinata]
MYEQHVNKFCDKLRKLRKKLENEMKFSYNELTTGKTEILVILKESLLKLTQDYHNISEEFLNFLVRTNTEDSRREKAAQEVVISSLEQKVESILQEIDTIMEQDTDTKFSPDSKSKLSHDLKDNVSLKGTARSVSGRSRSSRSSASRSTTSRSTTSMLLEQRVKAEAAKARLQFVQKASELKKEQARLDEQEKKSKAETLRKKAELETELECLDAQKELATAQAELRAREEDNGDIDNLTRTSISNIDSSERTRKFIEEVNLLRNLESVSATENVEYTQPKVSAANNTATHSPICEPSFSLNPEARPFESQKDNLVNLASFMLKKDLMLTRLVNFDDKPENFVAWKASFKSVVQDALVTPLEELDLLIRWLDPESKEHAKSIRAATVGNPSQGCQTLWARLEERYGSPELVETALKSKLASFQRLSASEPRRLYELSDILSEIFALKENPRYSQLFSYFDTSVGVLPIVQKLTPSLQNKWTSKASKYKLTHGVPYPPFSVFCDFVKEVSTMMNDPGLQVAPTFAKENRDPKTPRFNQHNFKPVKSVTVKKTDFKESTRDHKVTQKRCPIHDAEHTLNQCRAFRKKSIRDRKQYLREHNLCYRCCELDTHRFKACHAEVKCEDCGSEQHPTALHPPESSQGQRQHGGEEGNILTKCTAVCGEQFSGRSCAKAVLVDVYPKGRPSKRLRLYALVDDQSNTTLGRSELFDYMDVPNSQIHSFTLTSCAGRIHSSGRRASDLMIAAVDGSIVMELPTITECNEIPDKRHEIPTPEVVNHHPHLRDLSLPPLDTDAKILLLIGRDLIQAHHIHDQRVGPKDSPFAQKLSLGWVVIGDVCLGRLHKPQGVTVYKTTVIEDGRQSIFEPCQNSFRLTEGIVPHQDVVKKDIFQISADDDQVGLSVDDRQFLQIMEEGFEKDSSGKWKAPLPFRKPRPVLENNRLQALKRAHMLDASLERNSVKKEHLVTFMRGLIDSGAMEVAPPLPAGKECFYLPLFGVYHPRKPDKIRGVFDSSVKYKGLSLNGVLLSGPNLTNELLGVLMRFRMNRVAFMADVEQMFYSFLVREDHRDFLRFFWHRNNEPCEDLIEYRMRVHVFGNTPSPAVATYGLRKTVEKAEVEVQNYVTRNFYVDDGLMSVGSSDEAINLLRKTQQVLKDETKIRLHKIASNSVEVMEAFPAEDLEKNLKSLDIAADELPIQQSLGLAWDINSDSLNFSARIPEKPFTKRGLLSIINSLFDPLGFIAPIVIHGRILYREICEDNDDWDEPLPNDREEEWTIWKQSLHALENLRIPRMYTPVSLSSASSSKVHVYSDASEKAISAVVYLQTIDDLGEVNIGFVIGKSRIAPKQGNTIPRLELGAALLATELVQTVFQQLDLNQDSAKYYTDSRVVLGYLHNRSRRFYNYVSNRINMIHRRSKPEQWTFVSTQDNPADIGTRCYTSFEDMSQSDWLRGPIQLRSVEKVEDKSFPLVNPDADAEIRPIVCVKKTEVKEHLVDRFEKFSSWTRLVNAVSYLKRFCRRKAEFSLHSIEDTQEAERFIIRETQRFWYGDDMKCLQEKKTLPLKSNIIALHPFVDNKGILRVGGRLNKAPFTIDERNPVILPGKSHIARLLITHLHEKVYHQGRLITEGTVRSNGFWIIGCKRLVNSILYKCVVCRKLRGKLEFQQMADLPPDRVTSGPPFSSVGVDVFGPWPVVARRTRGGLSHSKRWAVLFTCMKTRAIHIEIIEEMSSSSFINALRRFISIRGPLKEIRSDRGTNFLGALDDIKAEAVYTEKGPIHNYLLENRITWTFNPPHASHQGGTWERMIGVSRKNTELNVTKCEHKTTHS